MRPGCSCQAAAARMAAITLLRQACAAAGGSCLTAVCAATSAITAVRHRTLQHRSTEDTSHDASPALQLADYRRHACRLSLLTQMQQWVVGGAGRHRMVAGCTGLGAA